MRWYEYTVTGPLLTTNRERKGDRFLRAANVKEWRNSGRVLALLAGIPPMEHVHVEFFPEQARGKLADAGAHLPSAKAVLDGIVDAGILMDDDPRYVGAIILHAPVRAKRDAMIVRLVPVTPMR
jgi:crossover junction endodeoxyribonuclease RusA